jgi:DNA-binding CsgD family transcriptional regulator
LRARAGDQLTRAQRGLTDEWRGSYYGVDLALAEAYRTRSEGRPSTEEFRAAWQLAQPFGAFFALEPRVDLAQELLAHGARDEGRELLVDCWIVAHDMGAGGLERRVTRLATRARVPLPESPSSEGPLSRLTPREREVLDQLARGATNKAIAAELVISEKTASVHVSHVLAKLGVENRGAAAALVRSLDG